MMDFQTWKLRNEELMREAENVSLAKALRESQKRGGADRTSALTWDLKTNARHLLKLSRFRRAG